jgi:tyrosine decarboxylase/aspartate 1-decarboxylase
MGLSTQGKSAATVLDELDRRFETDMSFRGEQSILPLYGNTRTMVLDQLKKRLDSDKTYTSGRILGAMTTQPHDFARFVFGKYLEKNLGDPGLIPATKQIETDLIHILGSLLGDAKVAGNMVSGGTEANIVAMHLARKVTESKQGRILNPEVVIPESAHYSFDKAADLMGLTLRRARLDENYQVNLSEYESLINENTIALVGVAGTTALGMIDPLPEIGKIARKHQKFFHVDGAFGGLVFPFLDLLGHNLPSYNLSTPEINSYTVDPHKAMGIIPAGALLVRDGALTEFGYSIPYLAGGGLKSLTITGTRPGASAISFWALLQYLGQEGFQSIIRSCWENTQYFVDAIQSVPQLKLAIDPICNVIGLQLTSQSNLNLCEFDDRLRQRGWALGIFKKWDLARVVVMPHVQPEHIDAFIKDVKCIFA